MQHLPKIMERHFDHAVLLRGQSLSLGDHVKIKMSEGMVKGRIHIPGTGFFDVYCDLKTWPTVRARCTCGRLYCEHLASALYTILYKQRVIPLPPAAVATRDAAVAMATGGDLAEPVVVNQWNHILRESSQDFFSYQLLIDVDGVSVDVIPFIAQWITRGEVHEKLQYADDAIITLPIMLHQQLTMVSLPFYSIKPILHFFIQFGLKHHEAGKITRNQLPALYPVLGNVHWQGSGDFLIKLQQVVAVHAGEAEIVSVPLRATLRPYQQQGIAWLGSLRAVAWGGILADDMGLGKTIQALGHLSLIQKAAHDRRAHHVIIVPTSLVMGWYDACQQFAPHLTVRIYHGGNRCGDDLMGSDLVITTYGVVLRDIALFLPYHFDTVILDEAQAIKNPATKIAQAVYQIKATQRLCLTGTPLENHLGELWSLFHFVMPGLLGDMRQFKKFFRIPIEKEQDLVRKNLLNQRIAPFILRRTKQQVARELPEKTEIIHKIPLYDQQRYLYEAIRMTMEQRVRDAIAESGLARNRLVLLDALLKLRQVCCDPRLLPQHLMQDNVRSSKLDFLLELIETLSAEGRKILVFSQFTSMLSLIAEALEAHGISYLTLTGKTRYRHRVVEEFQSGKAPVFLISLKAGGVGLNLTNADVVIHYDPWWNPQTEAQATDRAHRIGQTQPVFVYKLVAAETIEEAIIGLQKQKKAVFEGVFQENNVSVQDWSEEAWLALFQS